MDIKKYLQNLDWWLVGAVCLLSLFGLICIASATRINLGKALPMSSSKAYSSSSALR